MWQWGEQPRKAQAMVRVMGTCELPGGAWACVSCEEGRMGRAQGELWKASWVTPRRLASTLKATGCQ